jgi:8-oxo-dGTP diphosphatase
MKAYGLTVRGIIKNNDKILIVKRHPKSRTDPEMWELPGGKVEKGEFFADALVREIKEETNLDVKVGDFCDAVQNDYMHKRTVQIMMYFDEVEGEVKISDEHTEWMWASLDEIRTLEISTSLKKLRIGIKNNNSLSFKSLKKLLILIPFSGCNKNDLDELSIIITFFKFLFNKSKFLINVPLNKRQSSLNNLCLHILFISIISIKGEA